MKTPAGDVLYALPGPAGLGGADAPRTLRVPGSGDCTPVFPLSLAPCARDEALKYGRQHWTAGPGPHGTELGCLRYIPSAEREGSRPNKGALAQQPWARNAPGTLWHTASAPPKRRNGAASYPAVLPPKFKGINQQPPNVPFSLSRKCQ